ncbi:MAG TPA: 50S ribosomal protein L1 [Phycisphaerales bacterium]|nr:50S ribosomal protein L1 [Phycisphaerales bacterium]
MPTITKRTKANREIADKNQNPLPPAEAVKVLKSFKAPKFNQTVDVVVNLGVDPKQADQQLRGAISFPKGVGKTARVICFCQSDKAVLAKAAGAVEAGAEDLVQKIEGGWMDFDVAVASPDMMRVVSKLGKVLGPKGLMPSPKAGTVTPDVVNAVKEYSAGKIEYRVDTFGNVHSIIGKMNFPEADLAANLEHFLSIIHKVKPATSKGTYIKKCVISGTMTPGVPVAV